MLRSSAKEKPATNPVSCDPVAPVTHRTRLPSQKKKKRKTVAYGEYVGTTGASPGGGEGTPGKPPPPPNRLDQQAAYSRNRVWQGGKNMAWLEFL